MFVHHLASRRQAGLRARCFDGGSSPLTLAQIAPPCQPQVVAHLLWGEPLVGAQAACVLEGLRQWINCDKEPGPSANSLDHAAWQRRAAAGNEAAPAAAGMLYQADLHIGLLLKSRLALQRIDAERKGSVVMSTGGRGAGRMICSP
jgi:hypothetical protein